MKIKVFYSWQSDLPSSKNRSLIEKGIKNATDLLLKECPQVTEFEIDTDSRNELGTPDLAATIFNKIDLCDIFIADISIINHGSPKRLVPNPNVLLELGYAAKTIGWSQIICLYNKEYANVEELPFDIRSRKPIVYDTSKDIEQWKQKIVVRLKSSISDIVNNRILDKKEYTITKRNIDLGMQSILFDFCRLLFESEENKMESYNYPKLLNSSAEDINKYLTEKTFLGFHLYKNVQLHIKEFIEFFNDQIETYFLSESEKRIIAKMVYALREYNQLLQNGKFTFIEKDAGYAVVPGREINPQNPETSYLLLKPIQDGKAIVIAGGEFLGVDKNRLLNKYKVSHETLSVYSYSIFEIITIVNDWIKATGNYFIANPKEFALEANSQE